MKLFSKLFSIVLLSGVALSCCQEPQYATRAEKILAEMRNPNSDYVLVASHRGDWRNYPENSIPAIESVIRMGVDIMELDVKMTKDSVIVLSHDNSTRRCTNWKGEHGSGVDKQTLAEIKNLKLKTAHGVTTDSLRMPTWKRLSLFVRTASSSISTKVSNIMISSCPLQRKWVSPSSYLSKVAPLWIS